MKEKNQISLPVAILINLNIMIGAGLFINPRPLTQLGAHAGFISYIFAALALFPIALSVAQLATIYPTAGGMYAYPSKFLNPTLGFISGWGYFLGKTASPALLANAFVTFFHRRIPFLQSIPILLLDFLLIFLLIYLNTFGLRIGGRIQYIFIFTKAIPVIFVILAGLAFFKPAFFYEKTIILSDFLSSIPIAIFALLSFEMVCSIGHMIENPQKNIRKTVIYSFLLVASIAVLFQLSIFGGAGNILAQIPEPIAYFVRMIFPTTPILANLIRSFVFVSIIGGAFGSLTTNCWNLYKLAEDEHLPFKNLLTKINKNNVPKISLLIEGLIGCFFLAITIEQVPLQNMTVLSIAVAYLLNSLSAFFVTKKNKFFYEPKPWRRFMATSNLIPFIAIFTSSYMIYLCCKNLIFYGISIPFSILFLAGVAISFLKKGFFLNTSSSAP